MVNFNDQPLDQLLQLLISYGYFNGPLEWLPIPIYSLFLMDHQLCSARVSPAVAGGTPHPRTALWRASADGRSTPSWIGQMLLDTAGRYVFFLLSNGD